MPSYKLAIFDWDGTLCDSVQRIVGAMQSAMQDNQLPVLAHAEIQSIIGLGLPEAIKTLYPGIEPPTLENMRQAYSDHYLNAPMSASPLFPGAENLLEGLKKQGFRLAVATGKSRKGLDRVLGETGLEPFFDVTRCADETSSKPHPQMLQEILAHQDISVESALMIGDTEFDLAMAQAIGMHSVGVTFGVHAEDRLQACEPVRMVDHLDELADWLLDA